MSSDTRKDYGEQVRAAMDTALQEHVSELDLDSFTKALLVDLNKQKANVIWRLLGLDDSWGKWQVDHCNGRTSPITNYLTSASEGTIREWVNDAVAEIIAEERTKVQSKIKAALRKDFADRSSGYDMNRIIRDHVDAVMRDVVKIETDALRAEILKE